ncbi:MAG: glucosamine-6-phosphate deaminase [Clostridiaceae bacterium]
MNFYVFNTYEEVSAYAAKIVSDVIKAKKDTILGLATGSSPIGLYKELVSMYERKELDFSSVKSVNLDEYVGLSGNHNQSYKYFMNCNLFDHINIDKKNTFIPNGISENLVESAKQYDHLLEELGYADVQILGIGANGHIGFNEPAEKLELSTHVTDLKIETIQANARFFESEADVPKKAVTMGIGSILKAKKIILIASGENKANVVHSLEDDYISTNIPATLLKLHPDVSVILDRAAASLLSQETIESETNETTRVSDR